MLIEWHNGRSRQYIARKTAFTIPSIMTTDLTLKTVSISMRTGQIKISIGTVTPDFLLQK